MDRVGLGGGCHWCTEAVLQALVGVQSVAQGFISSTPPHDSFSEAVDLVFDPKQVPLGALIEVHLRTHASQSDHKMRGKYRSAVYVHSTDQKNAAVAILAALQPQFAKPLVTQALPFMAFKPSDACFQNYAKRNPSAPFCKRYIDPKINMIRNEYGKLMRA